MMYQITFPIVQVFANICQHSFDSKSKGLESVLSGMDKVN